MKVFNLHIKNMVCLRCIWAVERVLRAMDVDVLRMNLGYATVCVPEGVSLELIDEKLQELGFKVIENKEDIIVNKIKATIADYMVSIEQSTEIIRLSDFLSKEIGKNYNYLSKLFSRHELVTIENYYIHRKLARVKELLDYDELNLSEIAVRLNYSSVHYLSNQFKKVTGLSVSQFKQKIKSQNHLPEHQPHNVNAVPAKVPAF